MPRYKNGTPSYTAATLPDPATLGVGTVVAVEDYPVSPTSFAYFGKHKSLFVIGDDQSAAASNTANINDALTLGGQYSIVSSAASGVFYINDTLVVKSNTLLDLNGATPTLAAGTAKNTIVNFAHTQPFATVSGAVTSSGTTCTVNHAAHGYAVDDWVEIAGSTSGGYNGVHRVKTATTDSFTVILGYVPSDATSTGTPKLRRPDTNITVKNGVCDYNYPQNGSVVQSLIAHNTIFNGVQNLKLHNFGGIRSRKYSVLIGAVADFEGRNFRFDNTSGGSDGLHFNGPATRVDCHGFYGRTGDDFVSLTTGDYANWECSRGDYIDVHISGVFAQHCDKNLTKYAGNAPWTAINLFFTDIQGNADLTAVDIVDDTVGGSLLDTKASSIFIRDINANVKDNAVVVAVGSRIERLEISGIDCDKIPSNKSAVNIFSPSSGTCEIGKLSITGLTNTKQNTTFTAVSLHGVIIGDMTVDGDLIMNTGHVVASQTDAGSMVIDNLYLSGRYTGQGSGVFSEILWHQYGTIKNVYFIDLNATGVQQVYRQELTAAASSDVTMSNVTGDSLSRLSEFRKGGRLFLDSNVVCKNMTNTPVRAIDATLEVYGDMVTTGGAATDVDTAVVSGTPVLYLRGRLKCDGAKVTGRANDEFWNTNAAWASGSGTSKIGRYGHTGAAWVKIFGLA